VGGFTKKQNLDKVVYYEIYDDIKITINREKQIKSWSRRKKIELIHALNPYWDDLYEKAFQLEIATSHKMLLAIMESRVV
jgi:putative endonuclease